MVRLVQPTQFHGRQALSGSVCHTSQQEPAQNALVTEDGFELRFTLRRSATGN